ncbi:MAG: hypothetical protein WCP98_04040 [Actinomycetes bacterium]
MVIALPAVLLLARQAPVPRDDIGGQTPVGFLLLFVIGFVLVADDRVTAVIDRQWWWAPALGVVAMAARAALWPACEDFPHPSWRDTVVDWLRYQVGLGMVIVGLMRLFHRHGDREGGACATPPWPPICASSSVGPERRCSPKVSSRRPSQAISAGRAARRRGPLPGRDRQGAGWACGQGARTSV